MQLTCDALVLNQRPYGEDDRLLYLLTADRGVIRAYAGGAKRIKSRMSTATEPFCYSHFVLFHSRERYSVNTAEVNRIFFGIRQDIQKLALASYFAQLCMEFASEGEESGDYLRLLLNSLHLLDKQLRQPALVKPVFELRCLALAGYQPDLVGCSQCGCYEAPAFFLDCNSGQLICQECLAQQAAKPPGLLAVAPGILAAMRHILYSDLAKAFSFSLSQSGYAALNEVTQRYVIHKLEKNLTTLDFFLSLDQ